MADSRWELVKDLLDRAMSLPEGDRAAFIAKECSDPLAQAEVLRLLKASSSLKGKRGFVFLSYASEQAPAALEICTGLESRGLRCWIAQRDIPPGAQYSAEIVKAIDNAAVMVLLFTEGVGGSPHIVREIERAVAGGVPIILARLCSDPLTPSLEYFLNLVQHLDATRISRDQLCHVLAGALEESQRGATVADALSVAAGTVSGASVGPPRAAARTDTALESDRAPDRIGPYRVQRMIGRGGMGLVFAGVRDDDQFRKRVAIKLIKRGMDSDEILRRFDLERQVLSALNHPNIARLMDAGISQDGRPYFVMEFVEGRPIDDYCNDNRLGVGERLALFRKVCAAVHYAHQNLIVHRDLKPANILVTTDGEPKLLDFGIAKIINADLAGVSLFTGEGQRLMTPEYASPEQAQGQLITTATDVYSLGVVLYELLTGRRPYHFKTRMEAEIKRVICEEEPTRPSTAITGPAPVAPAGGDEGGASPPGSPGTSAAAMAKRFETRPETLRRQLAGDIDHIILMAMRKSPRRRYASAEQLGDDLRRHIDGLPVIARPETWSYVASKFIVRHRGAAAAGAAIVLLIAAGGATATVLWREAEAARREATAARDEARAQRDRAEQAKAAEQKAKELLGRQIETLFAEMRGDSGIDAATRERLTASVSNDLKKLLAERSEADTAWQQPALAMALEQLSKSLWSKRSGSVGKPDDALAPLEEAIRIRETIASAQPTDPVAAIDLARCLVYRGDLFEAMSDRTGAIGAYRRAHDVARSTGAGAAGPPRQVFLAEALASLGDLLRKHERGLDEAERVYRESLEIRRRQLSEATEPARVRAATLAVATQLTKMGKLAELQRKQAEAVDWYRQCLKAREDALPEPATRELSQPLLFAHENLGAALLNDPATVGEARRHIVEARQIAARRHERANDMNTRWDAARTEVLFARLAVAEGRPDASAATEAALRFATDAHAQFPQPQFDDVLIDARVARGDALAAAGNAAAATDLYQKAADLVSQMLKKDPDVIELIRKRADIKARMERR